MINDEVEFLIVQQVDGTLEAGDAGRLTAILASDPDARALLETHERLAGALRAMPGVPEVDAGWLRGQIGDVLDDADAPAVSYRMPQWAVWGPIAGAALLMITLTLGVVYHRDDGDPMPARRAAPMAIAQVSVAPMTSVATAAPRQVAVSVGAPANLSPQLVTALFLTEQLPSAGRIVVRPAGRADRSAFE